MMYLLFTASMLFSPVYEQDICQLQAVICQEEDPEYLIRNYADDVPTALRIANCESKTGKYRKNFQGSSATGLFQFMPKTWKTNCEGDIKSDIDQIKCFNKLYPIHKRWWSCR